MAWGWRGGFSVFRHSTPDPHSSPVNHQCSRSDGGFPRWSGLLPHIKQKWVICLCVYLGTFPARTLCCLWWRISDGLIAAVEANYANLNMLSLRSALLMPRLAARDRGCQLSPQAGVACLNLPMERKKEKKKKKSVVTIFLRKWIGALQTRGSFVALSSADLRVVASPWRCV